jgi:hypothetical protein
LTATVEEPGVALDEVPVLGETLSQAPPLVVLADAE